jgi:N6-adenosine-specific RNA methylase IME4
MGKRALVKVPAQKPIQIGLFTLTATGMLVTGKPSFDEYEGVGDFIKRAHQASGWWLADWLRYGESRQDWTERLSQAQHVTGLSEKRLKNIREVGAIEPSRRRETVEIALHEEVCRLPADEQEEWLERAETEGWTRNELRLQMRASKRRKVIEGQAVLEGRYRVLMADCPWRYDDSGVIAGSAYARAESAYSTMSIEDLCALPVEAHLMPNAVAFLWVPVPLLFEHPGPREVVEAWGLTYKSHRIWDKVTGMPSNYAQQITHEVLLICVRGDGKPEEPTPHEPSIFRERVRGEHSEKPNGYLRQWIEKHWTIGPYLELFGREPVEGWSVYGDDSRLWAQEADEQDSKRTLPRSASGSRLSKDEGMARGESGA